MFASIDHPALADIGNTADIMDPDDEAPKDPNLFASLASGKFSRGDNARGKRRKVDPEPVPPADPTSAPAEWECPICKDLLYRPIQNTLSVKSGNSDACRHHYCENCFESLKESNDQKCGICRQRMNFRHCKLNARLWAEIQKAYPEFCERRASDPTFDTRLVFGHQGRSGAEAPVDMETSLWDAHLERQLDARRNEDMDEASLALAKKLADEARTAQEAGPAVSSTEEADRLLAEELQRKLDEAERLQKEKDMAEEERLSQQLISQLQQELDPPPKPPDSKPILRARGKAPIDTRERSSSPTSDQIGLATVHRTTAGPAATSLKRKASGDGGHSATGLSGTVSIAAPQSGEATTTGNDTNKVTDKHTFKADRDPRPPVPSSATAPQRTISRCAEVEPHPQDGPTVTLGTDASDVEAAANAAAPTTTNPTTAPIPGQATPALEIDSDSSDEDIVIEVITLDSDDDD